MENALQEEAAHIEHSPAATHWKKVGIKHHHGLCIPLFSLHSQKSAGIGEYPDLIPMISWLKEIGLDILQLLPLNDTGPSRSPYGAFSAFALNPIHLGLASLPHIQEDEHLIELLNKLQQLNSSVRIDYDKVYKLKDQFTKEYFEKFSALILESAEYQRFSQENEWLAGYALFKALKYQSRWQSWQAWPDEIKIFTPETFNKLQAKYEIDITYHSFIQFLCFQQLQRAKQHADELGIYLKGDIPILVDRESADLWLNPSLFKSEFSAGAPPDAYSETGQNWQFPLYNWEEMEKRGYKWWKERLSYASHFYHIYRIDHIVGFFRIWAIPKESQGTEGSFIPSDPKEALKQGEKLMRMMLEASQMLPIGEDLGTVPAEVRTTLRKLGICGTKVMRWERKWKGDESYIPVQQYEPLSITTVSTHDSSTLQEWWIENSDEARAYCKFQQWEYHIPLSLEYHFMLLYKSHHSASLFHINLLQEYLAFFPQYVSLDPAEERINLPGVVSDLNWSYRYRPSVEKIISDPELALLICDLKK